MCLVHYIKLKVYQTDRSLPLEAHSQLQKTHSDEGRDCGMQLRLHLPTLNSDKCLKTTQPRAAQYQHQNCFASGSLNALLATIVRTLDVVFDT